MNTPTRRLKFIGCEILYREACYLAATGPHSVDLEFLRKGLHDLDRRDMLARIQAAVDAVDNADPGSPCEAILLGYARCNDGLAGLMARRIPLIIPKAHDCITLFFGSRQAFQDDFNSASGTYYLTTGWMERNTFGSDTYAQPAYGIQGIMGRLGLADSYDEMIEKYGSENAEYILQSLGDWRKNYSRLLYLRMGLCKEDELIDRAREEAASRDWEFDLRDGDLRLLRKLFHAQWDDDFLIVPPGHKIVPRNDEEILGAQPSD